MLEALSVEQANFIALLAKAARMQRDKLLGNVAEGDLAEEKPARGEHNPTASLGFAPLSPEAPQIAALQDAIGALSREGRAELYALACIGRGDLAARQWPDGMDEATRLEDDTVTASLVEDPDLHDHLVKGLYVSKLPS
jgi:hypothetical protein